MGKGRICHADPSFWRAVTTAAGHTNILTWLQQLTSFSRGCKIPWREEQRHTSATGLPWVTGQRPCCRVSLWAPLPDHALLQDRGP